MVVNVVINGYGTIGKRIADAILKQPDMKLVGVSKTKPDFSALIAYRQGLRIYTLPDKVNAFEEAGISVAGTIEEMIDSADIVIDATPKGYGAKYKELYDKKGVKAIFQGGEKGSLVEVSFSALCNYDKALGKRFVRVVSCNTTALCRIICALKNSFGVKKVRATIIRRGADPHEIKKGPIEALVPNPVRLPSHHGPDVKTVIPDVDIVTTAVIAPTSRMHMHVLNVELEKDVTVNDVVSVLEDTPRIILLSESNGFNSTAAFIEWARDIGRKRYDIYEVPVYKESITIVNGNELWLMYGVHQEAIVVPENIDAIRAMFEIERDGFKSINKTDNSLGILKRWPE